MNPQVKGAKQLLGLRGEQLAEAHLQRQGYTLVTKNWRCAEGEIDIIACKGDTWVFVEVRTRRAETTETAFASVKGHKQRKLGTLAQVYLAQHGLENAAWRIDVIAVAVPRKGAPILEHVQDALDW